VLFMLVVQTAGAGTDPLWQRPWIVETGRTVGEVQCDLVDTTAGLVLDKVRFEALDSAATAPAVTTVEAAERETGNVIEMPETMTASATTATATTAAVSALELDVATTSLKSSTATVAASAADVRAGDLAGLNGYVQGIEQLVFTDYSSDDASSRIELELYVNPSGVPGLESHAITAVLGDGNSFLASTSAVVVKPENSLDVTGYEGLTLGLQNCKVTRLNGEAADAAALHAAEKSRRIKQIMMKQ
ncbi:MAG: hypothetical protein AB1540_12395, partial [Bdellovibrionota bacterium]